MKLLSHVRLFVTPWTVACQAPLSMGFSRQEYWSGLPFSSPGELPDPGIKPRSPGLQAGSLLSEPPEKPFFFKKCIIYVPKDTHQNFQPTTLSTALASKHLQLKVKIKYVFYDLLVAIENYIWGKMNQVSVSKPHHWTSLVLRLHAFNTGGPGSIPGQGTRSHMPQLKDTICHNWDPVQTNK